MRPVLLPGSHPAVPKTNNRSFCTVPSGCSRRQPSLTVNSTVGKIVREAVQLVGDVGVIERDGMGVVAQRGGRVTVAEAGLGLEQQRGGHALGVPGVEIYPGVLRLRRRRAVGRRLPLRWHVDIGDERFLRLAMESHPA